MKRLYYYSCGDRRIFLKQEFRDYMDLIGKYDDLIINRVID